MSRKYIISENELTELLKDSAALEELISHVLGKDDNILNDFFDEAFSADLSGHQEFKPIFVKAK